MHEQKYLMLQEVIGVCINLKHTIKLKNRLILLMFTTAYMFLAMFSFTIVAYIVTIYFQFAADKTWARICHASFIFTECLNYLFIVDGCRIIRKQLYPIFHKQFVWEFKPYFTRRPKFRGGVIH